MSGPQLARDEARDLGIVRTLSLTRAQAMALIALPYAETMRRIGVTLHPRGRGWSRGMQTHGRVAVTALVDPASPDALEIRRRIEAIIGEPDDMPRQVVQVDFTELEWLTVYTRRREVDAYLVSLGAPSREMRIDASRRLKAFIDVSGFDCALATPGEALRNAILRLIGLPERPIRRKYATDEERTAAQREQTERGNAKARASRAASRAARPPRAEVSPTGDTVETVQIQCKPHEYDAILRATATDVAGLVAELGIVVGAHNGRPASRSGAGRVSVRCIVSRLDPLDKRGDLRDRFLVAVGLPPRIDTGGRPRSEVIRERKTYQQPRVNRDPVVRPRRGSKMEAWRALQIQREREAVERAEQSHAARMVPRRVCDRLPESDSRWPRGVSADDIRPSAIDGLRPVLPQRHSARDAWTDTRRD